MKCISDPPFWAIEEEHLSISSHCPTDVNSRSFRVVHAGVLSEPPSIPSISISLGQEKQPKEEHSGCPSVSNCGHRSGWRKKWGRGDATRCIKIVAADRLCLFGAHYEAAMDPLTLHGPTLPPLLHFLFPSPFLFWA